MAQLLDGNAIAAEIRKEISAKCKKFREIDPKFQPGLAIIQVGKYHDSAMFSKMEMEAATEIGIKAVFIRFPSTVDRQEVESYIYQLNDNPTIHGVIVNVPFGSREYMDDELVTRAILPHKDINGVTSHNAGLLSRGELRKATNVPCAPRGCLELIQRTGINICGKIAVIIGRSKIMGAPMCDLLLSCDATVTICHSKTVNIEKITRTADILVVAARQPEMVKGSWVKPGAVVIDCGFNIIYDETGGGEHRLVGDVDYDEVSEIAGWITPVPGGVGPMNVAMVMQNTVEMAAAEIDIGLAEIQYLVL